MNAASTNRPNVWLVSGIALILGLATVLIYLPVLHYEFVNWDDQAYVVNNEHVKGGLTWKNITWSFTQSHSSNWHPLTWISHMLDCQFYGLQPGGHHFTSAVLHAANASLVFLLLRMLTGAVWRSALVAALFAFHPLHVESVAWVSERKDVLSTFFGLLCLLAYARFAQTKIRRWYAMALGCFACGLMCKPMLVTWPFLMLLLDYWPLRRFALDQQNVDRKTLLGLVREKVPFLILAIASCVITLWAQEKGGAVASFAEIPLRGRIENTVVAYVQYLGKFFWPRVLLPFYSHPQHWAGWLIGGALAVLGAISVLAYRERNRFPFLLVGWLWYISTLVPVIGIIQVGGQAFADRYTYIPLVGIMIALVWQGAVFVRAFVTSQVTAARSITVLSLTIVMLLAWRTVDQMACWRNTQTLFSHALELSPDNVEALYGLGGHLVDAGRIAEGKVLLEKAIRLRPAFPEGMGRMADLLQGQGQYADAIHFYRSALAVMPDNAGILNNFAWLRASCSETNFRDGAEAVQLATQACELTGHQNALFLGTLAAAYAEAGRFSDAVAMAERARNRAQADNLKEVVSKNVELLHLYRTGKAYHEAPYAGR